MIEVLPQTNGNVLVIKATEKLTNEDYKDVLIPHLESIIKEYGRVRFLVDLSTNFDGWHVSALWDDVRFGVAHRNSFEKVAVVGGPKCAEWATKLSKILMNGEIKYFEPNHYEEAYQWVNEYSTTPTGSATNDQTGYESELVDSGTTS